MRVIVVLRHKAEAILHVERDRLQVGIHRQETATRLILYNEHGLDIIQHRSPNLSPFGRCFHAKATQLDSRVTYQPLFVRETPLFAKAVKLRSILKIGNGHLVVGETAIGINLTRVINVNTSICHCNQILLKRSSMIKDKIIQIPVATVKTFDSVCRV